MLTWSEENLAIQDAVRRFVDDVIRPELDGLEYEGVPP